MHSRAHTKLFAGQLEWIRSCKHHYRMQMIYSWQILAIQIACPSPTHPHTHTYICIINTLRRRHQPQYPLTRLFCSQECATESDVSYPQHSHAHTLEVTPRYGTTEQIKGLRRDGWGDDQQDVQITHTHTQVTRGRPSNKNVHYSAVFEASVSTDEGLYPCQAAAASSSHFICPPPTLIHQTLKKIYPIVQPKWTLR